MKIKTIIMQPLWRIVWKFLKKLKTELTYDPAIPPLGIYPEKTIIQKDTCTPMFTASLFTIAKTWKEFKCPLTDEWIQKWGVCVCACMYNGIITQPLKKNKITPFVATWMDLRVYHAK